MAIFKRLSLGIGIGLTMLGISKPAGTPWVDAEAWVDSEGWND